MNTALATGFLIRAAEAAFTPGPHARKKLVFDAMLQAEGDPEPTPWRCEIEDPMEIERTERLLTAGRGLALRAQLAGRPFTRHGVREGYVRFLRVEHVEFVRADRARAEQLQEVQAE